MFFSALQWLKSLSCIAFIFYISETNLLESDVERGPSQEITINQLPFIDVFLELLKVAVWLITKIIYDNLNIEDIVSSTECISGYDNNAAKPTESNVRGPKKPPKKSTINDHQPSSNQGHTKYFHDSNMRPSRDYGTNDNCNHDSYHPSVAVSQMTTVPTVTVHPRDLLLKCKNFVGGDCEGDNSHFACKTDANPFQNDLVGANNCHSNSNQILAKSSIPSCGTGNSKTTTMYSMSTSQTLKETVECYKKLTYAVLVGNTVRTCNTKLYASLPLQNKYMVKQRVQDSSGATRIRLVLKSSHERFTSL